MSDPEVVSIDIDRIAYTSLTQGAALVGATHVQSLGVTGSGVTVAVLDTGIDTDHPDVSANLIAEACFCNNLPGPLGCCPDGSDEQIGPAAAEDDDGHGTQSAGVIVSNSITNQGIAPDASIVAIKVLSATGTGNFSDVADGLDWVIDNRLALGIKVVNLSLGDLGAYDDASASPCTGSNTADGIAQLKNLGVSVFVASGNSGFDNGISFPACVPEAISVGGVYDTSFSSVSWCGATCSTIICTDEPALADSLVCNSNSGSLLDILAPHFQATVPTIGGGTISVGGTSISSPYAAGQAALLLEADPSLTPDQILSSLKIGAPMVTNSSSGLSFPRTRVDLAVAQLLTVCGNGALEAGEACDDNNTVSGDCCSATCELEVLGSVCDDGLFCNSG
ncbi:MAG: S8 family serine peptidase, partial [Myxococcales bacterium]